MSDVLPTFIIVGAARSGTTALYHWLSIHPEIYMSPIKETNFFVRDLLGRQGPGDIDAIPDVDIERMKRIIENNQFVHAGLVSTYEVYETLFKLGRDKKARGEDSPAYLYFADRTASRIRTLIPECRIIIILRNPVERAWSNYKALIVREYLNPEEAFLKGEERVQKGWEHFWDYLGLGEYSKQVKAFLDVFSGEQVGIWLYEDLIAEPPRVFREILRFIEVDEDFVPNFSRENASRPKLSVIRQWLFAHPRTRKALKTFLSNSIRKRLSAAADAVLGKELRLAPETREWLLEYYREDILRLHNLVPELNVLRWIEMEERKLKREN